VRTTLEPARSSKKVKTRWRLTTGEIVANSKKDKRAPSFTGRNARFFRAGERVVSGDNPTELYA